MVYGLPMPQARKNRATTTAQEQAKPCALHTWLKRCRSVRRSQLPSRSDFTSVSHKTHT